MEEATAQNKLFPPFSSVSQTEKERDSKWVITCDALDRKLRELYHIWAYLVKMWRKNWDRDRERMESISYCWMFGWCQLVVNKETTMRPRWSKWGETAKRLSQLFLVAQKSKHPIIFWTWYQQSGREKSQVNETYLNHLDQGCQIFWKRVQAMEKVGKHSGER